MKQYSESRCHSRRALAETVPGVLGLAAASLAGVVLAIALRLAGDTAWASHPKDPHSHLSSINTFGEDETYCAWAIDDSMSQPDALARIRAIDDSRWADVRWVDFRGAETACDQINNKTYRTYFYTDDDINWSYCGRHGLENPAGCAPGVEPMEYDPKSGHDEYVTFEIDLRTDVLGGAGGDYLVLHEVGHALGLADDWADAQCVVPSIMHGLVQNGQLVSICSEVPTDADAQSVRALEPAGSGGSFSFPGKWGF